MIIIKYEQTTKITKCRAVLDIFGQWKKKIEQKNEGSWMYENLASRSTVVLENCFYVS